MLEQEVEAWPIADSDLEQPAIGDTLIREIHEGQCRAETNGCLASCYHWTAGHLDEWWLAGTDKPGDVYLSALGVAEEGE
jgi:hypothetical protein